MPWPNLEAKEHSAEHAVMQYWAIAPHPKYLYKIPVKYWWNIDKFPKCLLYQFDTQKGKYQQSGVNKKPFACPFQFQFQFQFQNPNRQFPKCLLVIQFWTKQKICAEVLSHFTNYDGEVNYSHPHLSLLNIENAKRVDNIFDIAWKIFFISISILNC